MFKTIFSILFLAMISNAHATELYEDTTLLLESNMQAKVAGLASAGAVVVLKRQGFWIKIKAKGMAAVKVHATAQQQGQVKKTVNQPSQAQEIIGWTQLSQLQMIEEIEWMRPIDTLHDTGRLTGH